MGTRILYKGLIGNARAEAFDVIPENMVVLSSEEITIEESIIEVDEEQLEENQ